MPAISKKQIGIEARRKTANGRFYHVGEDDLISITNAEEVLSKPALIGWSAKVEREACVKAASDYQFEMIHGQVITPETIETYESELLARIGKTKASTKLLNAAGEIGTGTHSLIEWWARTYLKLDVGPRPKVSDKSEWGFMAFEDWVKAHDFRPVASEQVVFSHTWRYAGTVDLRGLVDGLMRVVDIKTGKAIYGEAKMQVAAYWGALNEMGIEVDDTAIVLRLPKVESDPEFEAVEVYNLQYHLDAFLHAIPLRLWQIREESEYKAKLEASA